VALLGYVILQLVLVAVVILWGYVEVVVRVAQAELKRRQYQVRARYQVRADGLLRILAVDCKLPSK